MQGKTEWPLWATTLNAYGGLALVIWMASSMGPFLAGCGDVIPGKEYAFPLACAWATFNADKLFKDTPDA